MQNEEEEGEEEECSDTETIQTLGELSAVETPDMVMVPSSNVPVCETQSDKKLHQLAMQFMEAKQAQRGVDQPTTEVTKGPVECHQPKNANVKKVVDKSNPNILPAFVTWFGNLCLLVIFVPYICCYSGALLPICFVSPAILGTWKHQAPDLWWPA